MKKRKKSATSQALSMELREHRSSFAVYVVVRALVILSLIRQIMNGNYENAFVCVLTLMLLVMPTILHR